MTQLKDLDKDYVVGIDTKAIDEITSSIFKCAEESNNIINKIDLLVYDTKEFFKCPAGDVFRNNYELLSSEKRKLNDNILSYCSDLSNAKKSYETLFNKFS